jgi:hypothetical protein
MKRHFRVMNPAKDLRIDYLFVSCEKNTLAHFQQLRSCCEKKNAPAVDAGAFE